MAMDLWYELRLRELSDVNHIANDLVRDAERASAGEPPDRDEED